MTSDGSQGFVHEFRAPASPDAPVLLLLHGTGDDERRFLDVGSIVAADAALLAPRGQVLESDGIPRFFRRIPTGDGSAYPFTFDADEVTARASELAAFVTDATERYDLVGRPVVAVGFSNGANMVGVLMLTHPALLRGGIMVAPMPILEDPPAPDLSTVAALLAGGRHDPIATPAHVEALAQTLADRGANVEVHWHDRSHELERSTLAAARDWVDKFRRATGTDPLP